ncbi:MAG TPA: class I SAM-dependent methyltransferase, partial [Pyrinomonadaceae bacterium]|nr:class I SAM-dependent methyltransferase [Pyrinomonadaceae bacterium]
DGHTSLAEEKLHARQQWTGDPCGAKYGAKYQFATRGFFDEVERHRYQEYAPWMPSIMGFNDYKGARLLEIGCGMGTDLLQFARGGAHCTGLDMTPRSIEISRLHFDLYQMRADFVVSDAETLPFTDESFDVVYSNGVLHHTPGTEQAIREVHRILRPGGTAKVMLYHRHSFYYWTEIILHRGLLRGHFLRGHSPAEIMSRYVEYSEVAARPLIKVYSRREARSLFKPFREVNIEVEQMMRRELRLLSPLVSDKLFERLRRAVGWNVIITAKK